MAIISIEPKHSLTLFRGLLIFLATTCVATCTMWLNFSPKWGAPVSSVSASSFMAHPSVEMVEQATASKIASVQESPAGVSLSHEKYGANAMGSLGAWDKNKEESSGAGREGSTCVDPESLSTSQLREFSRAPSICGYRIELAMRRDIAASDLPYLTASGIVVDNLHIEHGVRAGWTVSDMEGIALALGYGFTLEAESELYLLLQKNGSPLAQTIHDKWVKREIEEEERVRILVRLCSGLIPADISAFFC